MEKKHPRGSSHPLPQLPRMPVPLGWYHWGQRRCTWIRTRGATQWGNHEETLCPRLPLSEQQRGAETMDLLRGWCFIHPCVPPVIDGGSGGQQTLGAQPLNTLSQMAKGHALQ